MEKININVNDCANILLKGDKLIKSSKKPIIDRGSEIKGSVREDLKPIATAAIIKPNPPPLGVALEWELLLLGTSRKNFLKKGIINFVKIIVKIKVSKEVITIFISKAFISIFYSILVLNNKDVLLTKLIL